MANLLSRLAPKGYPGQVFVLKLRYGYGTQQLIEKLEILHSWYSNLIAYLPELYGKDDKKKEEYNRIYKPLFEEVSAEIDAAYLIYDGSFEGQTCNPAEKKLLKAMRGIKERLDVITAKSKIIDKLDADSGEAFDLT
jgi:hypothetical protein